MKKINIFKEDMPLFFIKKELDKVIVGENKSKLLGFISMCSIFTNNPQHFIYSDESSSGKSWLLTNLWNLFPDKSKVKKELITFISAKALNYIGRDQKEFTYDHKLLGFVELDGTIETQSLLRMLMSEGLVSSLVTEKDDDGKFHVEETTKEGMPVCCVTHAKSEIDLEFSNRCNIIPLDTSKQQTEKIKEFYALKKCYPQEEDLPDSVIKESIIKLKMIKVCIPYAKELAKHYPSSRTRARRDFLRFLGMLESICAIHQFQRKRIKIKNTYYHVANMDDYVIARELFSLISTTTVHGIPGATLKTYQACMEYLLTQSPNIDANIGFLHNDICNYYSVKGRTAIYRDLQALVDAGLLIQKIDYEYQSNEDMESKLRGRPPSKYYISSYKGKDKIFPTFEKLLKLESIKDMRWTIKDSETKIKKNGNIPLYHAPYNPITGEKIKVI